MPVQAGSIPVRSAGDGPRVTRTSSRRSTTVKGKPFPGAAAPFRKGGGRAKPVEGSRAEEKAETPAQEAAEKRSGTDKPTMRSGKPKLDVSSRRKLARSGAAMPDGSFPITNVGSLRDAIHAVGRAKDPEAAKRHIVKRARALNATRFLPAGWAK